MTQQNVSVIGKGGVSGYLNKDITVQTSPSGVSYAQVLLGRGKKQNSDKFLTAYSLMAYDTVAKLMEATLKKGDLIRITKVGLSIVKDENVEKYDIAQNFKLVVEEFEKIERQSNQNTTQQRQPQQQAQQPQPQPAPNHDSFDDDIPF